MYCSKCGAQMSDTARFCTRCGQPLGATVNTAVASTDCRATQQIGPVMIDEAHKMFRIKGVLPNNGSKKKSGIGKKALKGLAAVYTLGASVAVEKVMDRNRNTVDSGSWLPFGALTGYEVLQDSSRVIASGSRRVGGGVYSNGLHLSSSERQSLSISKRQINTLVIKVNLNTFDCPCLMIPLVQNASAMSDKDFNQAVMLSHKIPAALDVIMQNK